MKTIPCKILKIKPRERFLRQVIENVHHNSMDDWDTGESFKKVLNLYSVSPGDSEIKKWGGQNDSGETWLSEIIGKSRSYIIEHLELLNSSEKFKKALKDDEVKYTMARVIRQTPDEHKKVLEKKIIAGQFSTRDGANEVSIALKNFPDKANRLIKEDYSDCDTTLAVQNKIRKIVPDFRKTFLPNMLYDANKKHFKLGDITSELMQWLSKNPKDEVPKRYQGSVEMNIAFIKSAIFDWENFKKIKLNNNIVKTYGEKK